MKKGVRRILNLVSGLGMAFVALFLIFYLDIAVSVTVEWLLGISAFGLVGGALVALSSANIEDDDNWKAPIMAIAGTILMLLCDIVLLGLIQNPTIVEFAKYHVGFSIVYYLMFGGAIITTIVSLMSACVQNPEE
jgi:hypothetical protein